MAHQVVTYVPTALSGTSEDTTYFIRNQGDVPIRVVIQSAAPSQGEPDSFKVPPGADLYPTPEAGESIYVWAEKGHSEVVYVEAN